MKNGNEKNRKTIYMLLRTSSVSYDSRVRKELNTICGLGYDAKLLAVEGKNEHNNYETDYGTKCTTFELKSRSLLPTSRGLLIKALEMYTYMTIRILSERPNVVWVHDFSFVALMPILLLLRSLRVVDKIIWDQHELPPPFMRRYKATIKAYSLISKMCDKVIMANNSRYEYLRSLGVSSIDVVILKNYPDKTFCSKRTSGKIPRKGYATGNGYFLAQGGASPGRHFDNLVEAFVRHNIKKDLVVVGPYKKCTHDNIVRTYGENTVKNKIYMTGGVPQMELPKYIDGAEASIILYDRNNVNNELCAPNRLYQAICMGCPVIVGNNANMSRVVSKEKCGVVLGSDGENVSDIAKGVGKLLDNKDSKKRGAENASGKYLWEEQQDKLKVILS